jgi:hypothetical protein
VSAIGGSMFVAGGMLLVIVSDKDNGRWTGLAGIVLFGTCAVVPMRRLQGRWPHLSPHLPLLAAAAEIPWTVGLLALHLLSLADASRTSSRAQTSPLTAVAIVPAMFGLLWALAVAVHRPSLCPTARSSLARIIQRGAIRPA